MKNCDCPKCGNKLAQPITHEVDIGVGTQVFHVGVDCPACGEIEVCGLCGEFDGAHKDWCEK